MTSETISPASKPPVQYGARAWWQWTLGGLLIAGALGVIGKKYLYDPRHDPLALAGPVPVRISSEMKSADRVPAERGQFADCNLLLITLDTTRADRLGCYGNATVPTPNLDSVARSGVLFSNAVTPVPVTLPSHATMMTGRYPYKHGARCNGVFHLDEPNVTLAQVLAEKGYTTGGIISAFVLDSRFGIARGFQDYDDELGETRPELLPRGPQRDAKQTTERAVAWLRKQHERKFFLWVHYFDPHSPYKPPAPYDDPYRNRLYDGEVAFMDSQIGDLLAAVKELRLAERTLVVVAGDHGEGLNQHDEWTHGCLVYDATMRIPFMMSCGSRLGGGVEVERPVSLVDLAPTVLAMLGMDAPGHMDGIELIKPIPADRPLFLETMEGFIEYGFSPLLAVREGADKYIHGPDPELYDLSRDPFEEKSLYKSQPEKAARLKQRLTQLYGEDLVKATVAEPTHQLSPDDVAKLEALGYAMNQGGDLLIPPAGALPDPKAMMSLKRRVEQLVNEWVDKDIDKLLRDLRKIAKEHPESYLAQWYLGDTLSVKREWDEAIQAFEKCLQLRPNLPPTLLAMARALAVRGLYDEAISYYDKLLLSRSNHFGGHFESGRLLAMQGKTDEAIKRLTRAFELRPGDALVTEQLVMIMATAGRDYDAMATLEAALKEKPNLPVVRNALAGLLRNRQRFAESVAVLREGIALDPDRLELQNNLASLLATCTDDKLRRPMEAAQIMEQVCAKSDYKNPDYLHTLSVVYGALFRWEEAIAMAERAQKLAREANRPSLVESLDRALTEYRKAKQVISPMMKGRPAPTPTSSPIIDANP